MVFEASVERWRSGSYGVVMELDRKDRGPQDSNQKEIPVGALVSLPNLPEKGTCRLVSADRGQIRLFSYTERTEFLISFRAQPLFRFAVSSGAKVRYPDPNHPRKVSFGIVVERREPNDDGLFSYLIRQADGVQLVLVEGQFVPIGGKGDPLTSIRSFNWYQPKEYFARWAFQDIFSLWCEGASGLPAMLGARVRPLGHQLYTARRVLWDRLPRFILADEVGLGKTIEAGLVLQSLLTQNPELRILIIAPGSMSRQWLNELYLKFGARAFVHIDANRLLSSTGTELTTLAEQRRLIVSSTALTTDPVFARTLGAKEWDIVVIDEAHQFPPGTPIYSLLEVLALNAWGVLLLSATPSKRDVASLVGLLALVAPDVYKTEDGELLEQRQVQQQSIWDRLNFTANILESARAEGRQLDQDSLEFLAEEWVEVLPDDPNACGMIDRLRAGNADAAMELVAYVQEFYRLDHRVIRNRRKTLRQLGLNWAPRQHIQLEYAPSRDEAIFLGHMEALPVGDGLASVALRSLYWRFATSTADNALAFLRKRQEALTTLGVDRVNHRNECSLDWLLSDPGPSEEQLIIDRILAATPPFEAERAWLNIAVPLAEAWLETGVCERIQSAVRWIETHLAEEASHQVLVFTQDAQAVKEVVGILRARLSSSEIQEFHSEMPEADLAEVAFVFQHNPKCRLLVSDELGGEGRNFQNASAVVHLDLPLSTARIEQRVGRLDRIGRAADRPVISITLTGPLAAEQALLAVHVEVFKVFERSVGGLEFILPRLQRDMAIAYGEGAQVLRGLLPQLSARVDEALAATDEAFELSWDATKPQLDLATVQAQHLDEACDSQLAEEVVTRWARRLGLRTRRIESGAVEFKWEKDDLRVDLPGLTSGHGGFLQGTFNRSQALAHENLQYFGPGHQLIDSMLASLSSDDLGRVTAFAIPFEPKFKGTWLLHVLVKTRVNEALWAEDGMTAGLALRAESVYWPEVIPELVALLPGRDPGAAVVTNSSVRKLLTTPSEPPRTIPIKREQLSELPNLADLFSALSQGAELARSVIAQRQRDVAAVRVEQLKGYLRSELGWLKWQSEQGSAETASKARIDLEARQALLESVRQPITEIEGLALICLI